MDLQDAAVLFGSVALAVGVGLLTFAFAGTVAGGGAGLATLGGIVLRFGWVGVPALGRPGSEDRA